MKKLLPAALGLAVAVLPVLGVGLASAQDERDCTQAQREVARVELRLAAVVTEERNAEVAARDAAQAELTRLEGILDALPDGDEGIPAARAAVDAAKGALQAAKDALTTDSRRLANLRAELAAAVESRDEACNEDPTPAPTTPPTATTPPAADDVDCDEVTDDEAQRILDEDRADPHNLDDDNDGIACEEEVVVQRPDAVVVPSGGVNTGGWQK